MLEHNSCELVIQKFIVSYGSDNGALLPLLHAIQDEFGYIPKSTVSHISKVLFLSEAEEYGVLTFYHFFRTESPAKQIVQISGKRSFRIWISPDVQHSMAWLEKQYLKTN